MHCTAVFAANKNKQNPFRRAKMENNNVNRTELLLLGTERENTGICAVEDDEYFEILQIKYQHQYDMVINGFGSFQLGKQTTESHRKNHT